MSASEETVSTAAPAGPPPQAIVMQAGFAYIISACLSVAMKLRLADHIADASQDVATLAAATGANAAYLFRILRTLETAGLFTRTGGQSFALTAAGQLLRYDVPGSSAVMSEWITDPLHLQLYSELLGTVKDGGITFDRVYGEPAFGWLSKPENAGEAALFNNAMTNLSAMCVPAFLEAYDFSPFSRIIDIGGGHGGLVRSILKAYPALSGTVAEMASVVPGTRAEIERDGLGARCAAVECDFFAAVPAGGDLYTMKHIIHDWADEPALKILGNIRSVIPAGGKLVIADSVLTDGPEPHPGKMLDIEMMVFVGGKERTEAEFRELLAKAGFRLERVIPTKSPVALLEAVPV